MTMNGFHSGWLGISAQEIARTIGKKIANSIVGKSTGRSGDAKESPGMDGSAASWRPGPPHGIREETPLERREGAVASEWKRPREELRVGLGTVEVRME